MFIFRVLSGAVLLALVAGCADSVSEPVAGPAASASVAVAVSPPAPPVWVEPPSYTYVLTAGCTRGFYEARYRVVVKDGAVVSAVGLEEQAKNHPDYRVRTLGELAEWAARALAEGRQIRYERDPVDGHPVAAGFDGDAMAVDAGECFRVSDYRQG